MTRASLLTYYEIVNRRVAPANLPSQIRYPRSDRLGICAQRLGPAARVCRRAGSTGSLLAIPPRSEGPKMTQLSLKIAMPKSADADAVIADNGTIRIGGGYRLPPVEIVDTVRVRFGGGYRLPTA